MNKPAVHNWQSVHKEVLRRIQDREWKPGDLIPNEADLALEFGCARPTVNRALRALAETGLLDRRRKAGTRVAKQPVARATLDIPVIRMEIEARAQRYAHHLLERKQIAAPAAIRAAMDVRQDTQLLYVTALHMADSQPYAYEERWINLETTPQAREVDFTEVSCNEWLLQHTPYTHGDIAFSAANANKKEAQALDCDLEKALFVIDRLTWNQRAAVTKVRLVFAPNHQMRTVL